VAVPNIGDSGTTGLVTNGLRDPAFIAAGFRHFRTVELASAAWRANGGSATGLGHDIFARDPDELGREIARLATGASPSPHPDGGELLPGFGLALLETGTDSAGVGLAVNYGRTIKHGHRDQLNLDLFAFGCWLAPDLAYPEFATSWPHRDAWSINTISHNTVVVDGLPQAPNWGGHVRLFQRLPGLSVVQLEANRAYPQLKEYRRTLLLVTSESDPAHAYVVDVFHVAGGTDHLYSFHGPPGKTTVTGMQLVPQTGGTYAGTDVPYAAPVKDFPLGYSYLYDVRRARHPASCFTVEWKTEPGYRSVKPTDDIHLRLHVATPCEDMALARGKPPQNKTENPRSIDYALLHRAGVDLSSTFVTVLEPYRDNPFIRSVKRLPTGHEQQVALRVELTDGSVDQVLVNLLPDQPLLLSNGARLDGSIGYVRERECEQPLAALIHGKQLEYGPVHLNSPGAFSGKVTAMNREVAGGGWLLTDALLPIDGSLEGHTLMVVGDLERDNCYLIHRISREGNQSRIDCGPITFVRGFAGPQHLLRGETLPASYDQGYHYDFEPGAAFTIPVAATWNNGDGPARGSP
jgi:hypothetical protein